MPNSKSYCLNSCFSVDRTCTTCRCPFHFFIWMATQLRSGGSWSANSKPSTNCFKLVLTSVSGMTNTGQVASRTTETATVPISVYVIPLAPFVPITIKSTFCFAANWVIWRAGLPSTSLNFKLILESPWLASNSFPRFFPS